MILIVLLFALIYWATIQRKVYIRNRKGQFANSEVKKEKRIVLVKAGTKIVSYFAI